MSLAKQEVARYIHGGWFSFFCSVYKCFSRIAKLCIFGSFTFSLPFCFGKKVVFVAIGSTFWFCHKYWKIILCILLIISSGTGNTLLGKADFASIKVFKSMVVPFTGNCLEDNSQMCFFLFLEYYLPI